MELKTITAFLAAADISKLQSLGFQLLPAPGLGTTVLARRIKGIFKAGATPFIVSPGTLALAYGPSIAAATPLTALTAPDSSLLSASVDASFDTPVGIPIELPLGAAENAPLFLIYNGTSDPSAGDGSLAVELEYEVFEF